MPLALDFTGKTPRVFRDKTLLARLPKGSRVGFYEAQLLEREAYQRGVPLSETTSAEILNQTSEKAGDQSDAG